jgi:hypothetical protein
MMTLGDPNTFAMGLEVDWSSSRKPWMYGKLCMWICGRLLGSADYDDATLSDALVSLNHEIDKLQTPSDRSLAIASTEIAFFSIEGSIYGLKHFQHLLPPSFQTLRVDEKANYQLRIGDAFDDCKIYCVPVGDICRLIYSTRTERRTPWSYPIECKVSKSAFGRLIIEARDLLATWYSSLP